MADFLRPANSDAYEFTVLTEENGRCVKTPVRFRGELLCYLKGKEPREILAAFAEVLNEALQEAMVGGVEGV